MSSVNIPDNNDYLHLEIEATVHDPAELHAWLTSWLKQDYDGLNIRYYENRRNNDPNLLLFSLGVPYSVIPDKVLQGISKNKKNKRKTILTVGDYLPYSVIFDVLWATREENE